MINDIFSKLESNIQFSIYADDRALWLACEDMEKDIKEMQYALNSVMDWCNYWGFNISSSKTKAIIFSRGRKFLNINLYINDCALILCLYLNF